MTIQLDVIPGLPTRFQWGDLKQMVREGSFTEVAEQLVGGIADLCELKTKRSLNEHEVVSCPGYYYFQLAKPSTLSLIVEPDGNSDEAFDYVDDYGRNLTSEEKISVLQKWKESVFLVSVTSFGGRAKGEIEVMIHIVCCIARLTNGLVVVTDDDVFGRPVGIYSVDEFASSR